MCMAKKFKILLVFISLSLSLCIMSNTYSRYVADTTGNVEVLFAKWQIKINNDDITSGEYHNVAIQPTVLENEYVAENKVAPSSKGYFDIEIDPSNVDVSFDYSITLRFDNTDIPDLLITEYTTIDSEDVESEKIQLNDNIITGTDADFNSNKLTIRMYFEWFEGKGEEMDDTADSALGNSAAVDNTTFEINADISFSQKVS